VVVVTVTRFLLPPVAAAFMLIGGSGIAWAEEGGTSAANLAPVLVSPTLVSVDGGFTTLQRTDDSIRFHVHTNLDTSAFDATQPVRLQVAVFNNPDVCILPDGTPGGAPIALCNPGQIAAAGGSVFNGPSGFPTPSGRLNLKGTISTADTALMGPGLTNPQGAEVQILIRAVAPGGNPVVWKYRTLQFSVQDPA
jgi:hypothetical protein